MHVALLADVPAESLGTRAFYTGFSRPQPTPVYNLIQACLDHTTDLRFTVMSTSRSVTRPVEEVIDARLKHVVVPAPRASGASTLYLRRAFNLREAIKRYEPDMIHAHGADREFGLAAVWSRRPGVVTVHGLLKKIDKSLQGVRRPLTWRVPVRVEGYVLSRCRNVVALSAEAADYLGQSGSARQFRIPNVVAPEFFAQTPTRDGENVRLAVVGSIYPLKRTHVAIEAVAELQAQGVPAVLDVIGAAFGPGAAEYEQICRLAAETTHPGSVTLHGWCSADRTRSLLARATALLQLSSTESFSMTAVEALATGVSVIGTRVGILPELIDACNGRLLDDPSGEAVASAVRDVISADLDWHTIKESASPFSPARVASATVDMYGRILEDA